MKVETLRSSDINVGGLHHLHLEIRMYATAFCLQSAHNHSSGTVLKDYDVNKCFKDIPMIIMMIECR